MPAGAADGFDNAYGAQHEFADDDVQASVAVGDHLHANLLQGVVAKAPECGLVMAVELLHMG